MADDKNRDAWKKAEKVLASGNADESLRILREIDADGELSLTPIIQCKFLISIAMGINQD